MLTRAALVEGLIDASLLIVYSDRYAGGETPSIGSRPSKRKNVGTLDFLENDLTNWTNPIGFDLANIGLVTALGYLTFREVRDWKTNRPKIQEWYQNIGSNLPGFDETKPYSA